jgi:hypothetical protein
MPSGNQCAWLKRSEDRGRSELKAPVEHEIFVRILGVGLKTEFKGPDCLRQHLANIREVRKLRFSAWDLELSLELADLLKRARQTADKSTELPQLPLRPIQLGVELRDPDERTVLVLAREDTWCLAWAASFTQNIAARWQTCGEEPARAGPGPGFG